MRYIGIVFTCLLVLTVETAFGQPMRRRPEPPPSPPTPGLWGKSAVGGQLGPWLADEFGEDATSEQGRFSGNKTAFHLEFFYFPHLHGIVNGDFNIGAISRGEFRVTNTSTNLISLGEATLYPLGAGLTIIPFARHTSWTIQPHLRGGGSIVVLTERVDFTDIGGTAYVSASNTHTELGYYAGAGIFALLGDRVSLIGSVKYQRAKFGEDVAGARDYSGIQVLFGAAYLYH